MYPGLVCIYTCFLASQDGRQKFFPVFCGFYSEGCPGSTSGRARCNLSRWKTKMAETLVFLREFRSLTAGPAGHAGQQEIPASGSGNFFGSFREFLRSFGELRFVSCAPGARCLAGTYPQLIHNLVYIREFGSLK